MSFEMFAGMLDETLSGKESYSVDESLRRQVLLMTSKDPMGDLGLSFELDWPLLGLFEGEVSAVLKKAPGRYLEPSGLNVVTLIKDAGESFQDRYMVQLSEYVVRGLAGQIEGCKEATRQVIMGWDLASIDPALLRRAMGVGDGEVHQEKATGSEEICSSSGSGDGSRRGGYSESIVADGGEAEEGD